MPHINKTRGPRVEARFEILGKIVNPARFVVESIHHSRRANDPDRATLTDLAD